jgi:hypothetical protein
MIFDEKTRLVQIVPAAGWYVVYVEKGGPRDGQFFGAPLSLWGLVETEGEGQSIHGIDMEGEGADGMSCTCCESSNFVQFTTAPPPDCVGGTP